MNKYVISKNHIFTWCGNSLGTVSSPPTTSGLDTTLHVDLLTKPTNPNTGGLKSS